MTQGTLVFISESYILVSQQKTEGIKHVGNYSLLILCGSETSCIDLREHL